MQMALPGLHCRRRRERGSGLLAAILPRQRTGRRCCACHRPPNIPPLAGLQAAEYESTEGSPARRPRCVFLEGRALSRPRCRRCWPPLHHSITPLSAMQMALPGLHCRRRRERGSGLRAAILPRQRTGRRCCACHRPPNIPPLAGLQAAEYGSAGGPPARRPRCVFLEGRALSRPRCRSSGFHHEGREGHEGVCVGFCTWPSGLFLPLLPPQVSSIKFQVSTLATPPSLHYSTPPFPHAAPGRPLPLVAAIGDRGCCAAPASPMPATVPVCSLPHLLLVHSCPAAVAQRSPSATEN
jgi:hypothetical protein